MKNSKKILLASTFLFAASGSMNLALGGAAELANSAAKLAQATKDKDSMQWITGKTFRGNIQMTIPTTGVLAKFKSLFKGPDSKEQPFKLEFRGTLLDKLNPFRKPSYWKMYLVSVDNREAVVSVDLEYKIKDGILTLLLYHEKKLALTFSEPMAAVLSGTDNKISSSAAGASIKPEPGSVLADAKGVELSINAKSALEQLKLKMQRSGESPALTDQIISSVGQ